MNEKAQAISEFLATGIPGVAVDYTYLGSHDVHLFQVKRAGDTFPVRFSNEIVDDSTVEYLHDLLRNEQVCARIHDGVWPGDTIFTHAGLTTFPT